MRPSKDIGTVKHRTRIDRILLCVVLLLLFIQVMGGGSHQHALADTKSDCAACYFADHPPAGFPPASAEAVPVSILASYCLVGLGVYLFMAQPSYLIPLAQAPPRRLSTF